MTYIGVDPGVDRSGICVVERGTIVDIKSLPLWELFDMIKDFAKLDGYTFVVENSNLTKGNWHGRSARGNVGKNKSISQAIVDCCVAHNAKFVEIPPKGYSILAKNQLLFRADSKYTKSTNVHERSAWFIAMAGKALSVGDTGR